MSNIFEKIQVNYTAVYFSNTSVYLTTGSFLKLILPPGVPSSSSSAYFIYKTIDHDNSIVSMLKFM